MLTHPCESVSLSLVSTDLPVWSVVKTGATLYSKEQDRFHLLLTEPKVIDRLAEEGQASYPRTPQGVSLQTANSPRLLWLEISPYRLIMTMQGNGRFSYRHYWERGVYGLSRYWLQSELQTNLEQLRLRNFTRRLVLQGHPLPEYLQLEYELWSDRVQLGSYVLNLEIHH
ncbi:MAG: hypothetical protein SFW36_10050 [Leptolyngbyaceae cyanobacterium bins.59]|nr:hypothetical protein [Leptolyngbyaceae cyanobacterium bins.59]